jgi:hypothetical protein
VGLHLCYELDVPRATSFAEVVECVFAAGVRQPSRGATPRLRVAPRSLAAPHATVSISPGRQLLSNHGSSGP